MREIKCNVYKDREKQTFPKAASSLVKKRTQILERAQRVGERAPGME